MPLHIHTNKLNKQNNIIAQNEKPFVLKCINCEKISNTEPQAAWLQGSRRGQVSLAMASPLSPQKQNKK